MNAGVSKYQEQYYDGGQYSSCKPYVGRRLDILTEYVGSIRGCRILDVGCYQGDAMERMQSLGALPKGVDISGGALRLAAAKGLDVVRADVTQGLPFDCRAFDVVYCSEVIEHVLDTDGLLEELKRVLKSNGVLFVSTPNICCARNRARVLLGRYPCNLEYRLGGAGHIRLYNLEKLRDQFQAHGFRRLRCVGVNLIPWKWCQRSFPLMRLNGLLARAFPSLCLNIAMLGTKTESAVPE